jgi:DNA mismatch repair protein MutL
MGEPVIAVLAPEVIDQIAAGEVIERPASIVKELVENALDAGAARISVSIRGGGIDEIVIQDDGGGIPADEIEQAFNRHATPKLTSADDLWAIQTLGFGGEALPAIAAIAQVSCVSRVAAAPIGAELRIAGGEVQGLAARGCSPGTTFTIRNLFYNIPVRRAFLKSAAAEAITYDTTGVGDTSNYCRCPAMRMSRVVGQHYQASRPIIVTSASSGT